MNEKSHSENEIRGFVLRQQVLLFLTNTCYWIFIYFYFNFIKLYFFLVEINVWLIFWMLLSLLNISMNFFSYVKNVDMLTIFNTIFIFHIGNILLYLLIKSRLFGVKFPIFHHKLCFLVPLYQLFWGLYSKWIMWSNKWTVEKDKCGQWLSRTLWIPKNHCVVQNCVIKNMTY